MGGIGKVSCIALVSMHVPKVCTITIRKSMYIRNAGREKKEDRQNVRGRVRSSATGPNKTTNS